MKYLTVLFMLCLPVALSGCEVFQHVTCAPKVLVETCLQEAYAASAAGFGPYCASLNEWAKLHDYSYGGGPPLYPKPTPAEVKSLEGK